MKSLNCYEVCGIDCGYVAKGSNEREIVRIMFHHGETYHKELLEDMNEIQRQKVANKMHNLIRDAKNSRHRM